MKRIFLLLLALLFVFAGCENNVEQLSSGTDSSGTAVTPSEASFTQTDEDMFTSRDTRTEVDEASSIQITLNNTSASCSSGLVSISGSTVTITGEGTYIVSGTLTDGMIIVDAAETDKPQIVLNGVSITKSTSAAIYVKQADKVFVTLNAGSTNTLANGGSFTAIDDNNIDAAVFSKADITFNGSGSLTVTSPAGHGIVAKDDLVFTGGTYNISSSYHGVDANDSVRIANSAITAATGKDCIHCENTDDAEKGFVYISSGTFDIDAQGDGISASNYLQILDGSFDIVTGGGYENAKNQTSENWGGYPGGGMGGVPGGGMRPGGRSATPTATAETATTDDSSTSIKGLKASGSMQISGGTFSINSADDAVHSNLSVTVKGGKLNIRSGDDGVHADETLTVSAGDIIVTESYEGLEALHINIFGGNITLTASDDGLNAAGGTDQSGFGGNRGGDQFGGMGGSMSSGNGSITISGGTLNITASGDGIDANGTLTISGGYTTVTGPTQGDTATLDYDRSATISGGTFIGTGAQGMAQTFSDASQGLISVTTGNCSANTKITLTDKKGNVIIEHTPAMSYAVAIISSPDIKAGESYTLTVGSGTRSLTAQ